MNPRGTSIVILDIPMSDNRPQSSPMMGAIPLRFLGLFLLSLAILIPGCQAIFAQDARAQTTYSAENAQ